MRLTQIRNWLASVAVVALAACGGGGGGGDPLLGGGTGGGSASTAASVSVSTASATMGDSTDGVLVTAVVRDANNVAMPNTTIGWATTAGSLTGAATVTDASGKATATLSATSAERAAAAAATVTATSGAAKGTASVALQGVRTVVITTSKSNVGTDGDTATVTALVRDANNLAISGASVVWTTSAGVLSGQSSATNASGLATATFAATGINPGTTPSVTVTASTGSGAGAASAPVQLLISASSTTVELLASQPTVGTGGEQITLTAFVKDGNNLAKAGAPVSWSVDNGRISAQVSTTNTNGLATAVLDAGSNKANRTAVVTVNSGVARQTLNVPVVNTKLSYSGATTVAVDNTVQLTVTAADSRSVPIPGATLTFASSEGYGVPATATATTDAAGQAIVTLRGVKAGKDRISVSGLGATIGQDVLVTGPGAVLAFDDEKSLSRIDIDKQTDIAVLFTENGQPKAGVDIRLAATIGSFVGGVTKPTGADGKATFTITSSFAGASTITATAQSAGITLQSTVVAQFQATKPSSLSLQLDRTALPPNLAGSKQNRAQLIAKVVDKSGNPVTGVEVNFSQQVDPSGGRLEQASAVTGSDGVASVQYLSGPETTASGAVLLSATVVTEGPAISHTARLTVNQSALFIALGTGNTISNFDTETYEKRWTVYVTDANGVRVTNVPVTIKVIPTTYGKGELFWNETASLWDYRGASPLKCANEDQNFNGRLDLVSNEDKNGNGVLDQDEDTNTNGVLDRFEDVNGDGTLTPGNVVGLTQSTVTTDANGAATIVLRYAELYASWIDVRLTATAIVSGTESTTFKEFPLDKLAGDYSVKTVAPAGVRSPFGVDTSTCSNPR